MSGSSASQYRLGPHQASALRWRWKPGVALLLLLVLAGCGRGLAQPPTGPTPTAINLAPGLGNEVPTGTWLEEGGFAFTGPPSLTADPLNNTAYLCFTRFTSAGVRQLALESTQDNGQVWQSIALPPVTPSSACSLGIDPLSNNLYLFVGFSGYQQPEMGAMVYRSQNAGGSWQPIQQPTPAGSQQLSVTTPITAWNGTLFALAFPWNPMQPSPERHALLASRDNGQSWAPIDDQLVQQGRGVLTFALVGQTLLTITTYSPGPSGALVSEGVASGGGIPLELWATAPDAINWQLLSVLPEGSSGGPGFGQGFLRLFSTDARSNPPGTLYLQNPLFPQIATSPDGGRSWAFLPQPLSQQRQVALMPLSVGAQNTLYAVSLGNFVASGQLGMVGMVWSPNRGRWQTVTTALPPSAALQVSPDNSGRAPYGVWWAVDGAGRARVLRYIPSGGG